MEVYAVLIHTERGVLGGVFSSMEGAMRYVEGEPGWSWSIAVQHLDDPPHATLKAYVSHAWKAAYFQGQKDKEKERVRGDFPPPPLVAR